MFNLLIIRICKAVGQRSLFSNCCTSSHIDLKATVTVAHPNYFLVFHDFRTLFQCTDLASMQTASSSSCATPCSRKFLVCIPSMYILRSPGRFSSHLFVYMSPIFSKTLPIKEESQWRSGRSSKGSHPGRSHPPVPCNRTAWCRLQTSLPQPL